MDQNPLKRIERLEEIVMNLESRVGHLENYVSFPPAAGGRFTIDGQAQTAEATQNTGAAASGTQGAGKEDPTSSGDQGEAGGISGAD